MPCTDYGRTTTPEEEKAYLGYNRCELEDAFCSACTALEFAGVPIPPAAAAVWAAHKANDDKQCARESLKADREKLRQDGLGKLSASERDALGLR